MNNFKQYILRFSKKNWNFDTNIVSNTWKNFYNLKELNFLMYLEKLFIQMDSKALKIQYSIIAIIPWNVLASIAIITNQCVKSNWQLKKKVVEWQLDNNFHSLFLLSYFPYLFLWHAYFWYINICRKCIWQQITMSQSYKNEIQTR